MTTESAQTQHQQALLAVAPPSVLLDAEHDVLHVAGGAERYLGHTAGVPSLNLLENVPPPLRLELRTMLFKAQEANEIVSGQVVLEESAEVRRLLTLWVYPVHKGAAEARRWLVTFQEQQEDAAAALGTNDMTADHRRLLERLETDNKELKADLQQTVERFAAATEEYRASNEELQAINEELRSASEELETSKEELQSVNEELETVNAELHHKVDESARINDDLRNLMASSDIATVFVDSALRVKRFTPRAGDLFNLIASDLGRPLLDVRTRLLYDEMADDARAAFDELRTSERRVASVDGEHFFARVLPYRTAGNRIDGAVLTFFNVTQLHQAEERTRTVEQQLRDAVFYSDDFAVLTTDDAGTVISWNVGAQQLFGFPAEEIIGRSVDELFVPEDRAGGAPQHEREQALQHGRAADERWHLRQDGSRVFCSGVTTAVRRDGGGHGFAKIVRDATESNLQRQAQSSELLGERRLAKAATEANQLKDKFLAVMSHELKQPLNLMMVNAQLLTRLPEVQPLQPVMRIGHSIQRAVKAQEKIVNDLLELSRASTGKLRLNRAPVDLREVVQTLAGAAQADAQVKGIELRLHAPTSVVCLCDHVRVEQIVWNLLGNAMKFTPQGGTVDVSLQAVGPEAELVVRDSGVGIDAAFLPHMFDMFSQAERNDTSVANKGLGIGLALVAQLTAAHGGRVQAESDGVGTGARFTVLLPLTNDDALVPNKPGAVSYVWRGKRVLMVDDDIDMLQTFAQLMQTEGAQVDTAPGGEQALDLLQRHHYDLLLSDLGMPGMDGIALISRVRKLPGGAALPALAVSGLGRPVDVQRAKEAGFDAHVSKPVTLERLNETLTQLQTKTSP